MTDERQPGEGTREYLEEQGYEVVNDGTDSPERFNYHSGYKAARMVADGKVDGGMLICGTFSCARDDAW